MVNTRSVTAVILDELETSLAGTLLLVEYDGNWKRLCTWLWNIGLSRNKFNSIHIGGYGPGFVGLGTGYVLAGCSPEIHIDERILARKWSGRLLIQGYSKESSMFLRYAWQDTKEMLRARFTGLLLQEPSMRASP